MRKKSEALILIKLVVELSYVNVKAIWCVTLGGDATHMSIYPEREPIIDQSNNYTSVYLGEPMRFYWGAGITHNNESSCSTGKPHRCLQVHKSYNREPGTLCAACRQRQLRHPISRFLCSSGCRPFPSLCLLLFDNCLEGAL